MSGLLRDFQRVTRRAPCPICGHGGWCLRARDGSARAICNRVPSPRRWGDAGWFHGTLTAKRAQRTYHLDETPDGSRFRLISDACLARAGERPEAMCALAGSLGVRLSALYGLSVGLDERGWSTWPMHDHLGRMIGIRERGRDRKRAVTGSANGLFLPNVPEQLLVLVTEGESDCAAALSLGFFAIGRPGCQGAEGFLSRWCAARPGRELAIIADADQPGREGAAKLAEALAGLCSSVRVALPPRGEKDLRAALLAGADHAEVLAAIEAAATIRPTLRVVERGGR